MATNETNLDWQSREGQLVDRMGTYIYSTKDNKSRHKSLNSDFTMNRVLLQQIFDNESSMFGKESLIEHFKPTEDADKKTMTEFDNEYKPEEAVFWYTKEGCVYKILNKALRTQDINNIRPFGQLIRDIDCQLDEEHKRFKQGLETREIQVYRGQLISKDEITRLKSGKGEYVSMNSFMPTTTSRQKALEFAINSMPPNDELTTVLLEINVDTDLLTKPYADIRRISAFPEEEEVLFMFGAVFRIESIEYDESLGLWMTTLTLCPTSDEGVRNLSSQLEEDLKDYNEFIYLGFYFIENFQLSKAEKHFQLVLDKDWPKDDGERAQCYYGLSQVHFKRGDYSMAVDNIKKTLKYLESHPAFIDHPLVSSCYHDLGCIYTNERNFELALKCLDKALSKNKKNSSQIYLALADLHFNMGNNQFALECLEKSLRDYQLQDQNASMADTYIRMAKVLFASQEKDNATSLIEKAIECQLKDLPTEHPDLAYSYAAFGSMYLDMNDYEKALEFFEKADGILTSSLPKSHHDFADSYKNFATLYLKQGDIDNALLYYEKLLENQLKRLPPTSTLIVDTYATIGNLYWKKYNYEKAELYLTKVLDSRLEKNPIGHKTISDAYKDLGNLFLDQNNWERSLFYYLNLIDNELKRKLKPSHALVDIYKIVAKIFYTMNLLDKSLAFYFQAIDYHLLKKSNNEKKLSEIYESIGQIYLQKAHSCEHEYFYGKTFNNNNTVADNNGLSTKIPASHTEFHIEQHHVKHCYQHFKQLLEQLMKNHSEKDDVVADTLWILAYISYDEGDFNDALIHYRHLLRCKQGATHLSDPLLIHVYRGLAFIYYNLQNNYQSLIYFNLLIDYHTEERVSQLIVDQIYTMIGTIYLRKNHFRRYLQYVNKSIGEIRKNALKSVEQLQPKRSSNDVFFERRHLNQANSHFIDQLNKTSKNDGTDIFSLDDIYNILGNIALERENFEDALVYFQVLLTRQCARQASDQRELYTLAYTYVMLGNTFNEKSNFERALESYQQALRIYEQIPTSYEYELNQVQEKIDWLHHHNI